MNVRPLNDQQLRDIIQQRINYHGPFVSLNDLDVSRISNMNGLFKQIDFRGDISNWDTSNVEHMRCMFENSSFNGDISKWNTSRVRTMTRMFEGSSFNGDISQWNVESVNDMARMFRNTAYGGNLSLWNPKRCMSFLSMFDGCTFVGNLSGWMIRKEALTNPMLSPHFQGICPTFSLNVYEQWDKIFCSEGGISHHLLMELPLQRLHWAVAWLNPSSYSGPPEVLSFVQASRASVESFGLTFDESLDMLSSLYAQSAPVMNTTFEFAYDH